MWLVIFDWVQMVYVNNLIDNLMPKMITYSLENLVWFLSMARDTGSHSLILPDIEMIQNWLSFL